MELVFAVQACLEEFERVLIPLVGNLIGFGRLQEE